MANQPAVLILARSAQLRKSLEVLIASSARVQSFQLEEDVQFIQRLSPDFTPGLVVFAFEACEVQIKSKLEAIKALWPQAAMIALVESECEFPEVRSAGAEAILIQGTRASQLIKVIESLLAD